MTSHNAKKMGIVALVIALAVLLTACETYGNKGLVHKSIRGMIVGYEQSGKGLIVTIETSPRIDPIEVLILEDTMWGSSELMERMVAQEIGIYVSVESEYLEHSFDGVYPAVAISEW